MLLKILLTLGSSIFLVLGPLHLIYTFFSTKCDPYDAEVKEAMHNSNPRITRETSMWKAWIGFNASHSTGAIFFGLATLYLVFFQFEIVSESAIYTGLCAINSLFYLFLARNYWFSIPLMGTTISSVCFVSALLLTLLG